VFRGKDGEIRDGESTWIEIRVRLVSCINVVRKNYTHFIAAKYMPFPIDAFSSAEPIRVRIIC